MYTRVSSNNHDEDNGEFVNYGIAYSEGAVTVIINNISTNMKFVDRMIEKMNRYGLDVSHFEEYVYDELC